MNIKLIIFDLDGVLIDAKELHFLALNEALLEVDSSYVITKQEHLTIFEGLSTRNKLKLLTEIKSLPLSEYDKIFKLKQIKTKSFFSNLNLDLELIEIMKFLKSLNLKICVASNSIKDTLEMALSKLGIKSFIDFIVSNEDVKNCKPHPEMYCKCMSEMHVFPEETLIIEDSPVGRTAAIRSHGNLLPVKNRNDLNKELIHKYLNKDYMVKYKWVDNNLNILVPMAGRGSRFFNYDLPKPLIDVQGKPMIQKVVENINVDANYIFLCLKEHFYKYNLNRLFRSITTNYEVVIVDEVTEGAACTSLLAKEFIDNKNSLLIVNSDQLIDWDSNITMYEFSYSGVDGGILTFEDNNPKWSYVKMDKDLVIEVAEKQVISNQATVGIYFWKYGSDYVKYANEMIKSNKRVNGEFYICPVFNEAIRDGKRICAKMVNAMWGLGTPEDLDKFLLHNPTF